MAKLVPITCPTCNAPVSLEEGRDVVDCPYCETSSVVEGRSAPASPKPAAARQASANQAARAEAPARSTSDSVADRLGTGFAVVLAQLLLGGAIYLAMFPTAPM